MDHAAENHPDAVLAVGNAPTALFRIAEKIEAVATKVYRADGVDFLPVAQKQLAQLEALGFSQDSIYATLENRMKCGLGKCGRCNVGPVYVCKEGPVFKKNEILW